jgi:DNA repair exonuclease SbcCD ATPase subunit
LIEQAIFSCIGFLVAALLALAAAPAIARRARRLAEARARLQAPLTEAQAIAERDALRAQHAVDQFRLEQRLTAVATVAAQRQIEIGRQGSRIVALEEASAELTAQSAALAALEREARELRGELGAAQIALRDLAFQRDASAAALAVAQARRHHFEALADHNRTMIATFETRTSALEVRLADSERVASAAVKPGEAERARLSAALEETLLENGRQFARIAERDAALRESEAAKRDLADQLSLLAAAHKIADEALNAERALRAELQREVEQLRVRIAGALPGRRAAGDQALRNAIARLGRDVARLNGKAQTANAEPSNLFNFDRREGPTHPAGASEALHTAPAGKIRQGQPMAPER